MKSLPLILNLVSCLFLLISQIITYIYSDGHDCAHQIDNEYRAQKRKQQDAFDCFMRQFEIKRRTFENKMDKIEVQNYQLQAKYEDDLALFKALQKKHELERKIQIHVSILNYYF